MTLDEAIRHCEEVAKENERIAFDLTTAFNMETIKSKECKKCANEYRQLAEWLKDYKRLKEQEPCKDAISRQAVHEAIVRWAGSMSVLIALPTRETIPLLDSIHKLPSVNPQEIRTGHWITEDRAKEK